MIFDKAAKKLFDEKKWSLATCGEDPDVANIGFKKITDEGLMMIGVVFLEDTVKNIKANGKAVVAVFDDETREGYKVRGKGIYTEDKEIVELFKGAKGVIVITPYELISTTPTGRSSKIV